MVNYYHKINNVEKLLFVINVRVPSTPARYFQNSTKQ